MNKLLKDVIIAVLSILAVLQLASCGSSDSNTALKINGTEIDREEYSLVMSTFRSEVILTFSENYSETDFTASFWEKSYAEGEKTPIELLREKTLQKLIENHCILSWAKDEGIIAEDSFSYIMSCREKENAARASKLQENETVYGVSEFSKDEYYDYVISNCAVKLKNIISEELSDDELEAYYEENKSEYYSEASVLSCKQIFVESVEGEETAARGVADRIMTSINGGVSMEDAARAEGLECEETSYDLSLIRTLSIRLPSVSAALYEMAAGETRLIEEYSDYYILQIVSESEQSFIPLEDVLPNIQTSLALEKFNSQIQSFKQSAEVKQYKKVIDAIG